MAQNNNYNHNNGKPKRKLPYIKARIDKLVNLEESKTKAFASVTIGGAVAIHGIRVMNSAKGLFVAMPASTYIDDNGEKHFSEIKQSENIFEEEILRLFNGSNSSNLEKQRSSCIFKSKSSSCNGEGLTRKTSTDKVEIG